jgi:hypothetical protein
VFSPFLGSETTFRLLPRVFILFGSENRILRSLLDHFNSRIK